MKALHTIAFILVVVGGLNWGLVAINPGYDLVALLGSVTSSVVSTLVYALVGVSAVVLLFTHKKTCRECSNSGQM
jgi:uncharacterized membrane protein YuzA (DUF378 family)